VTRQEDPGGKCRPVQVNDQAWQRRVEYSSEIVGARKAHENGCQDKQGHSREEKMVVTAAWQVTGNASWDCLDALRLWPSFLFDRVF